MQQWYIGVDETGKFNHLDANDTSNASAIVTQKSPKEILDIFTKIYAKEYPQKKDKLGQLKGLKHDQEILGKFHGCEQKNKFKMLDALLNSDPQLIDYIVQSEGKPYVTTNPQQWWMSAVLGILFKALRQRKIKKGDTVTIEIANRNEISLGLIKGTLANNRSTFEQYNKILGESIENWLKSQFKEISLSVMLRSAGSSPLPTLADQISNIIKPDYQKYASETFNNKELLKKIQPLKTFPINDSFGEDVQQLIDKDDFIGAIEALLSDIFSGHEEQADLINKIITDAPKDNKANIWNQILATCETALINRGNDGKSVNHVEKILSKLDAHYDEIPSESIKKRYLKVYADFVSCAGNWSSKLFEHIEQSFKKNDSEYSSHFDRWDYYTNVLSAKAQTYFNVYRFGEINYKKLVETQEQFEQLKFPFATDSEKDPDKIYADIYGTIGQDLAFAGKTAKAIPYFEKSFNRAPNYIKSMYASFLAVVYVREKNLEKAQEWLAEQTNYTENSKDQWLVLNQLRVYSLAIDLGEKIQTPDIQTWHNDGDYPWPLLLKWLAFIEYKNGETKKAMSHLELSFKKLKSSTGFTVRTLALSVASMQINIAQNKNTPPEIRAKLEQYKEEYCKLLDSCCKDSEYFASYTKKHPEFEPKQNASLTLWDTMNLLPFNYS